MQTLGRLTAVILATAAVTALPTASDAANSWTTVTRMDGAKHQACKVPVNGGADWKIKNRLVNGNQTRVGAGMYVQLNGEDTGEQWRSGLVARGQTSPVGSVTMPRGDSAYTLVGTMYEAQAGGGGPVSISDLGRC